jgi:hypothetical protein
MRNGKLQSARDLSPVVQLSPEMRDALEAWVSKQAGAMKHSDAIRKIVSDFLTRKGYLAKGDSHDKAASPATRPTYESRRNKASETDRAAREIIDAETQKRDAKTARLRAQREAAAEGASFVPKPKKGRK